MNTGLAMNPESSSTTAAGRTDSGVPRWALTLITLAGFLLVLLIWLALRLAWGSSDLANETLAGTEPQTIQSELDPEADLVPSNGSTSDTTTAAVGEDARDAGEVSGEATTSSSEVASLDSELDPRLGPLMDEIRLLAVLPDDATRVIPAANELAMGFADLPLTHVEATTSFTVVYRPDSGVSGPEHKFTIYLEYLSLLPVAEVLALHEAALPLLDLPLDGTETGSDREGAFTKLSFGSFADHPDPAVKWAHLGLTVHSTDTGSLVNLSWSVAHIGETEPGQTLLTRLDEALPRADGYDLESISVRNSWNSDGELRLWVSSRLRTPGRITDVPAELSEFTQAFLGSSEWTHEETSEKKVTYQFIDNEHSDAEVAVTTVNGSYSIVTVKLRFRA